jgi:ribonuclease HII
VSREGTGPCTAVILHNGRPIQGLADSKTLSEARRIELAGKICQYAHAWAVAEATVEEIDRLNILEATLLAMQRAVQALAIVPQQVLVDGNRAPRVACPVRTVIRGDATIPEISAASILAKVARDARMLALHDQYPRYGFSVHKGYPTRKHLQALEMYGVSPGHRRTFGPVRRLLTN